MKTFENALVTYKCKTLDCPFASTTKGEALEHQEETGHRWFHVQGGMPGAVGVGFAA